MVTHRHKDGTGEHGEMVYSPAHAGYVCSQCGWFMRHFLTDKFMCEVERAKRRREMA